MSGEAVRCRFYRGIGRNAYCSIVNDVIIRLIRAGLTEKDWE